MNNFLIVKIFQTLQYLFRIKRYRWFALFQRAPFRSEQCRQAAWLRRNKKYSISCDNFINLDQDIQNLQIFILKVNDNESCLGKMRLKTDTVENMQQNF